MGGMFRSDEEIKEVAEEAGQEYKNYRKKVFDSELRDKFAAAALTGLLSRGYIVDDATAKEAFMMADIMLNKR